MPNETEGHDHDMKVFPVSNFHCTQKIFSSLELKVELSSNSTYFNSFKLFHCFHETDSDIQRHACVPLRATELSSPT